MIGEELQVVLVELEREWELPVDLMYYIQKLEEHRGETRSLVGRCLVGPVGKAMTEAQPLLFDERAEAVQRAVVRVEQHLGHRDHLGGEVGAVLQADEYRGALHVE